MPSEDIRDEVLGVFQRRAEPSDTAFPVPAPLGVLHTISAGLWECSYGSARASDRRTLAWAHPLMLPREHPTATRPA